MIGEIVCQEYNVRLIMKFADCELYFIANAYQETSRDDCIGDILNAWA